MIFKQQPLPYLLVIMLFTFLNSYSQKKVKILSAGVMVSRITEKPFNFSNGQWPGVKPMFEYQVEKNIFGGYFYTYGIGFKGLGERRYKVFENFKLYDIELKSPSGEIFNQPSEVDTVYTYVGDLTNKHRIKLSYVYFPAGFTYYAGEKLSFSAEYSLAYVWGGFYKLDVIFSDYDNTYRYDYSVDVDLPGGKTTNDRYVYRWDHWVRFSARYNLRDFLVRFGFEKGLRNAFTGKNIPGSSNGKTIYLHSENFFWQNTSLFLTIGIKLSNQ